MTVTRSVSSSVHQHTSCFYSRRRMWWQEGYVPSQLPRTSVIAQSCRLNPAGGTTDMIPNA